MLPLDDTIAALASAPGAASRGILRISGCGTADLLGDWFQSTENREWRARTAAHAIRGHVPVGDAGIPLPAWLYYWPTRRSYTGEPLAELHTLGSPPLLDHLLQQLFRRGARPARPGEFTLRAFVAGRIDLAQAEAVLGVIDANNSGELKAALEQLGGGLSSRITRVRSDLLDLLADLEAGLDFVDEDITFVTSDESLDRLDRASGEIRDLLQQAEARLETTPQRRVALVGLPNAGKSTLFNALARESAAIVSSVAGTTRDWLSRVIEADGFRYELIDTAGWEAALDPIAAAAQGHRSDRMRDADLLLWCEAVDASPEERAQSDQRRGDVARSGVPWIHVRTKADRLSGSALPAAAAESASEDAGRSRCEDLSPAAGNAAPRRVILVSASDAVRISQLNRAIEAALVGSDLGSNPFLGTTAARSRDSLSRAQEAIARARVAVQAGVGDDLVALELRSAHTHLGEIVGALYTNDLLDRIFSRFCIGK